MTKKAQAGLEFLLTYGWAILVAVAAVGSLFYIGTLNPENIEENTKERCEMPPGIVCLNPIHTGGAIEVTIRNDLDINMAEVSLTIDGKDSNLDNSAGSESLAIGEESKYVIDCSPEAGMFKGDLIVEYIDESGAEIVETGEIVVEVPH